MLAFAHLTDLHLVDAQSPARVEFLEVDRCRVRTSGERFERLAAREVFADRVEWERLMKRAVARDFSWANAAKRYEELYASSIPNALAA